MVSNRLQKMIVKYASERADELLSSHPYHFSEIVDIINEELRVIIKRGVEEYTEPHLNTKHLTLDTDMRLMQQNKQ